MMQKLNEHFTQNNCIHVVQHETMYIQTPVMLTGLINRWVLLTPANKNTTMALKPATQTAGKWGTEWPSSWYTNLLRLTFTCHVLYRTQYASEVVTPPFFSPRHVANCTLQCYTIVVLLPAIGPPLCWLDPPQFWLGPPPNWLGPPLSQLAQQNPD